MLLAAPRVAYLALLVALLGATSLLSPDSAAAQGTRLKHDQMVPKGPPCPKVQRPCPPGLGRRNPPGQSVSGVDLFVGLAYTPAMRYLKRNDDGNAVLGLGFGDPASWLGVQTEARFYSTARARPADRMGVTFEVYRWLPGELLLRGGWENLLSRGEPDTGESRYVTLTRWIRTGSTQWFSVVGLTAGAGDGRFVKEEDWLAHRNRVNAIGGVYVQVNPMMGLAADWEGDDLALTAPLMPLASVPLTITPGVADAAGRISSGPRFVVSAGYTFQLRR